ncbi:MAG: hypothetical protein RLZZ292_141 [Bacteroidota bacterium]
MKKEYDIAIAGAGIAACAAAILLQQTGQRVCMLDDVAETSLKIGEALPGAAKRLLLRLGISGIEALLPSTAFKPCVANVSAWKSNQWTYRDAMFNPEGGGWHLCRNQFDAALRAYTVRQGVTHYAARIANIRPTQEQDAYSITFKKTSDDLPSAIQAKWVIDATGRASFISKTFFKITKTAFSQQMAAVAWLHCPTEDAHDQTTRIKSVANGWWYTARLPNATRVLAFCGQSNAIATCIREPETFVQACNSANLLPYTISSDIFAAPLRAADASVTKLDSVGDDGWLAIGDAVLSFDPLSSQGMFFAMYSGIQGAETILNCFENPSKTTFFLQQYQQLVQNVFDAQQQARAYYYG